MLTITKSKIQSKKWIKFLLFEILLFETKYLICKQYKFNKVQDINKITKMNLLTLSFPKELEPKFRDFFFDDSLKSFRISYLIVMFLYGVFGVLDTIVASNFFDLFFIIRFIIVIPFLLLVFLLSYFSLFRKVWQLLIFISALIGGTGIIVMLVNLPDEASYFHGLILVIFAAYFFVKLRFIYATLSGFLLVAIFNFLMINYSNATFTQIVSYNFFYITANILGMFASYYIELIYRRNYLLNLNLKSQSDDLHTKNINLEEEIKVRTKDLEESREKLNSLFNSMSEMVVFHQMVYENGHPIDYLIIDSNAAFTKITGISRTDAMNKLASKLYNTSPAPYLDIYAKCVAKNSIHTFETYFPPMDKHFAISAVPLGNRRFATITSDITERKKAEKEKAQIEERLKQTQKLESLGTLAGGIAHDFNNILAGIYGYNQILQIVLKDNADVQSYLEQIEIASNRAKDLIQQILSFSRRNESEKVQVNIVNLAKEVVKLMQSTLPHTVKLSIDYDSDIWNINANPTQIHQIILNLLTNAHHALVNETGFIKVQFQNQVVSSNDYGFASNIPPGNYVRMTVTDNGTGIDKSIIDKIFDPYFTTKPPGKGTGLGLPSVLSIVKEHNGGIKVYSEVGIGTTFSVYLPKAEGNENTQLYNSSELAGGSESILIVDDEISLLEISKITLESLGYKVEATKSAIDALEKVKSDPNKFNLIISDVNMPELNGVALAKEVIQINNTLPIILTTGYSKTLDDVNLDELNIKAVLLKPVSLNDFSQKIRDVLDS